MSFNSQLSAFKSSLASQANLIPSRAISKGEPIRQQDADNRKRKQPVPVPSKKQNEIYSQPADTSLSQSELMTQVHYIVQYLKEKETPQTSLQLSQYLSKPLTNTLKTILKSNPRLIFDAKADTFEYRPVHNIRTKQALLQYLKNQPTAEGLQIRELKEGWSAAMDSITALEAENEVLVTRTKKDNQPRRVWYNDKELNLDVEKDFKDIWESIKLPHATELPALLDKAGLKPTSVDPATMKKTGGTKGERKRPKARRGGRVTNTHLAGILKDYSK